jgi:hypothetical protein
LQSSCRGKKKKRKKDEEAGSYLGIKERPHVRRYLDLMWTTKETGLPTAGD